MILFNKKFSNNNKIWKTNEILNCDFDENIFKLLIS